METGHDNVSAAGAQGEFSHAADKLEFHSLLAIVASYARAERSRDDILATVYRDGAEEVERGQREIASLVALRDAGDDLPIGGWRDSTPELRRIHAEGVVADGEALAHVADGERSAKCVRAFLGTCEERAPDLYPFYRRFEPNDEIIDRIAHAIGPDYEVLDRASADLARVRREIAKSRNRLRSLFTDFAAKRGSGKGYEFVTVRGERFVVSLPRSEAAGLKGIVHHESGSGASIYIEPLDFVEGNNRLERLVQEEYLEVERILKDLTGEVYRRRDSLAANQDAMRDLDVVAAKATFAQRFRCRMPEHCDDGTLVLRDARHPLLEQRFVETGGEQRLVPLNLVCGPDVRSIVVSGPNAGGKTLALKTVGILVMMDKVGLLLPVGDGTKIPRYDDVFVDIGDDQSIERSLSTFSSRVVRVKDILAAASPRSLVLVDEIGDGTDPDEGAALAEAILDRLTLDAGRTIVTTHLGTLKGWAHETRGAVNATLEFDPDKLEPLFTLRMGVPGRSWGIETAGRMGLPPDIIEQARAGLGEDVLRLEELLAHLERTEHAVQAQREELIKKERLLTDLISSYRDRLDHFTRNREEMEQEARKQALDIVTSTRREMEHLVREIRTSGAKREVIKGSKETLRRRGEHIERRLKKRTGRPHFKRGELEAGMWVEITSLGRAARIVSVEGDTKVLLELDGGMRVETGIGDLGPHGGGGRERTPVKPTWSTDEFEPVSTELMVRGLERAEALERVDYFIDRAVLQGLGRVMIIHGVGRGILRRAVYDMLKKDPRVRDIHPAEPALGGDGVAVVELQ